MHQEYPMTLPRCLLRLAAVSLMTLCASASAEDLRVPGTTGVWVTLGRAAVASGANTVTIANGTLANLTPAGDCELSFRGRMPKDSERVQIWGAMRVKDSECRYAVGLRGLPEPQLSIARYAPDGDAKFLGFAPLDPAPVAGQWYTLRLVTCGNRFLVFLDDEALPRLNVEDKAPVWSDGGVGIGGGWLPTEFNDVKITPLTGAKLAAIKAMGDKAWAKPAVDKAALRARQRAAYRPATITTLPAIRGELPLDGPWLFMPDQDLAGPTPIAADLDDQGWHTIAVPGFWTPTLGWLHGESGLPDLKGLSASKGPSDLLMTEESDRVEAQTFDWRKTRTGWYRHHLELPADLAGRRLELSFEAIARIADVWVNGTRVGRNVGMFRELLCDISKAAKPGRNVVVVRVAGILDRNARKLDDDKVEAVAVTVNVTGAMLNSLPHGMTDNSSGGIWQPVKLVVTNPARVASLFIQPQLDSAAVAVELANADAQARTVELAWTIRDATSQAPLTGGQPVAVTIPATGTATAQLQTAKVQPKLWTPQEPNLYLLELTVSAGGKVLDRHQTRFGFRTFAAQDGRFLLNGKPYWLRGGNHLPATIRPNDTALARRFITLARAGNVMVTRTHALPFSRAWLDLTDELGMGVSYEGTWPWLMIKGEPPAAELLAVWKDEFASLLRKCRNHPSLLFWTVNNEMNFASFDRADLDLLKRKWTVLDDMIRAMRRIDPTRPISAYSGYVRHEAKISLEKVVTPNRYDDGDLDDVHTYNGWYNPSCFHFFKGEFGRHASPGRPLISQEISTGYPRNDDWPSRSYQFPRQVPQALVGQHAFEQNDPLIFMTRQSMLTKELTEIIRRTNRNECAGLMPFAYLTWFTDVWKADRIRPKLTYHAIATALQPVLVSAELTGRHVFAGTTATRRVCLINDAEDAKDLAAGRLAWELRHGATVLAQGAQDTPPVAYYANQWIDVAFAFPATLPLPRVDAQLALTYTVGGTVVSRNSYDWVVATRAWSDRARGRTLQVFDPGKVLGDLLAGHNIMPVGGALDPGRPLVVADLDGFIKAVGGVAKLVSFVTAGGRVLLVQPGKALAAHFPDQIKGHRAVKGEIVSLAIPESPLFAGIAPLDLAWFEQGPGNLPQACTGTWQIARDRSDVTAPAHQCDFHPDVKNKEDFYKKAGAPLVEIRLGKGLVIASAMLFPAADPVAVRLAGNVLEHLCARR